MGKREPINPKRREAEKLLRKGVREQEIADRLGVVRCTVWRWREEIGLPRQPRLLPPPRAMVADGPPKGPPKRAPGRRRHGLRTEAEALLREGRRPVEVAATLGVDPSMVGRWRQDLGLPPLPRPVPPRSPQRGRRRHPLRDQAEALLRGGKTITQVHIILGVSSYTMYKWQRQVLAERRKAHPAPSDLI